MELLLLGLFALILLACVIFGISVLPALILGYFIFTGYGLYKKHPLGKLLRKSLEGILSIKNILITFILIGMLTAIWRAVGTIPYIVYYATGFCKPSVILLSTFLLCCLVSFLTGTSFGSAATIGVICMTMAGSMGISPVYAGGAVLSGIYFGDRCSPMSTSALLVSEITGTNIFDNIPKMMRTSLVPFGITCIIYTAAGFILTGGRGGSQVQEIFASAYDLQILMLIPALVIVIMSARRCNVKITMFVSILSGIALMLWFGDTDLSALASLLVFGFHPEDAKLAALISGGGILSMAKVFSIVCLSSSYSGIFKETGFLDPVRRHLGNIASKITTFGAILVVSVATCMIACNQTLATMLTQQLCGEIEPDGQKLAIHLENSVIIIAAIVPWCIACVAPLQTIGATTASVLFAFYLWLIPLWNLIYHLFIKHKETC